ncbi:hypothetical protein BGZ81_002727 [Podila clonocystis]|nr:hypothetical protein BGZ81_002727 [Podila clonocystis]
MYKSPPIYEIPLILQLICSTLYAKDIANCVLVCKTWHDLFSPYMWRNLDDQYELDFKEWTSHDGGLERLLLNAQHIRKLALFDSRLALILQGSRCTHLTRLRIREQMPRMAANAVMTLIERNPKLEELLLDQPLNAERDEIRLIQTIPKLHRLKKISVDMLWHGVKQLLDNIPDSVEVLACGPYVVDYDQEWLEDQDDHDPPIDGEQDDFDAHHDDSDSEGGEDGSNEDDDDDSMDDSDMDDDEYGSDGDAFDDDEIEELANSMPPEQLIQMMNGALDEAETGSEAGSEDEDMGDDDSDDSSGSDDGDMYDGELAFKDEKVVEYKDTDDTIVPGRDGKGGGSGGKGGPGPLDLSDDTKRGNLTGLYLDLVLGSDDMLQFLPMLRRFPNLQHFGVPHASDGNLEVLSRVLRRHCPNVDSLSITQRWTGDTALERLVQDRRQLKQIKIRPPTSFEIRMNSAIALAEHHLHLERIDMFGVRMASDDIQTILTTCPNLLSFRLSPYSDPKEPEHTFGSVVGPSGSLTFFNMVLTPWVCTKLKFLSIRLSDYCGSVKSIASENEEEDPAKDSKAVVDLTDQDRKEMVEKVYRQLGRLHELEMLEIGVFHEEVMEAEVDEEDEETALEEEIQFLPSESGMDFSLASGLDYLKTLKHLQCLRLLVNTDSSALSKLPEAKWIAHHWKRLQYLDGVSAPAWGGIGSEEDTVEKSENPAGYEYLKTKMPDLVIRERV